MTGDVDKLRMLARTAVDEPVRITENGRDVMLALADEIERLRKQSTATAPNESSGGVDDLAAMLTGGDGIPGASGSVSKSAKNASQSTAKKSLEPLPPAGESRIVDPNAVPLSDPFANCRGVSDSSAEIEISPEWLIARLQAKRVPSKNPNNANDHYVRDYHRETDNMTLVFAPMGHLWMASMETDYRGTRYTGPVDLPPARWQIGPVKYTRDVERILMGLQIEPAKPKFVLPSDGGPAERVSPYVEQVALEGW